MKDGTHLSALEQFTGPAAALTYALAGNGWYGRTLASEVGRGRRGFIAAELAHLAHKAATHPDIEELLAVESDRADATWPEFDRRWLRRMRFSDGRARALKAAFVADQQRAASEGYDAWLRARKANDYGIFAPVLRRVLKYAQIEAQHYGAGYDAGSMYDALLGNFEPHMTTAQLAPIFETVKRGIMELLPYVRTADDEQVALEAPKDRVLEACAALARKIGFDMGKGGVDVTMHPFCETIGPDDVRITVNPSLGLTRALMGIAHEAGHGMFEQGVPPWFAENLPRTYKISLGIHESQSRLWENHVCRTPMFWECFWDELVGMLQVHPDSADRERFVASLNTVRMQPIRIAADEMTYPLHIIMRYELERGLLDGSLDVEDLPAAFDAKLAEYLGVVPANLSEGVLQDVHWSEGFIGYFPTYLLGSLAAAQLFAAYAREHPDWESQFRGGNYASVLAWLRAKVHGLGMVTDFNALVVEATGEPLNPQYWLDHIRSRYSTDAVVSRA